MTDYLFSDPTPMYPFGDPVGGGGDHDYAEARAEVPRDQWDRYLIPSADGVAPAANKGRTRVSTVKKVGSSTANLQDRAERLIVQGLADPHLHELAVMAAALPEDTASQAKVKKAALRKVAARAYDKAGGNERRDLGNRMHELTDALNRNRFADGPEVEVPQELQPEIDAYYAALDAHDLSPVPELMERVVLCPYDTGGAFDNIMRRWNPDTEAFELVIVDLKTGQTLEFSWLSFLIQLWMYANAYFMYVVDAVDTDDKGKVTAVRGHIEELPLELRRDKAILIRCPMDGSAEMLELDLSGVGRYAAASIELKRGNAEAKYKYRSLGTVRPAAFEAPLTAVKAPIPDYIAEGNREIYSTSGPATVPSDDPTDYIQLTRTEGPAPTPDQLEQEAKAVERLAKVSNLGSVADKQLKPLDLAPFAVKGQRGCGVCHRVGHKRGSAKCLGDADPGLATEPDPMTPAADEHSEQASMVISPEGPPPVDVEAAKARALANAPYCTIPLPHKCEWTAVDGQWVCSVTGKPSKMAWEAGQTRVTAEHPHYGMPEGEGTSPSSGQVAEATAQAQVAAGQPVPPTNWAQPPDMVAWGISNAETASAVLDHRAKCMAAHTWTDAYDTQAQLKYRELMAAGRA